MRDWNALWSRTCRDVGRGKFRATARVALSLLASHLFALPLAAYVHAQEWVPTRPLRLIVPFPPGGTSDLLARTVAPALSEKLGQQIVVDNRGGGGGIIGAEAIARAQPDGYTFGVPSLSAHAATATLAVKLPYDPIKDFQPLTLVARSPLVLVVGPSNAARSVQDLLAPGRRVNFGSAGIGLANHIAGELLKLQAKADMVHVPYKGGGPAMADIMAGHLDMMFNPLSSVMPLVQGGRLRALAIVSKQRSPRLPNVATIGEAGFPNLDIAEWWGLLAPARTPIVAVRRLREESIRVLERPDIAERLSSVGVEVITSTPEELRKYIAAEIVKYREIIQRAGIKAN